MSNDQSNPSTSTPTPPSTPTHTSQVNGDIDQARDTGPNNDQSNSVRIDDFLPNLSAEERRRWAEAIDSQNDAPVACMSDFWTLSSNGFNLHTDSETPVAAAMENLAIYHSSDTLLRPDTPLPTGGVVENDNAPPIDWDNQPALDLFTLLNQDAAAPSENTSANNQTNPANPNRRNRRAQRPIPSFDQMTPEQREAFWQEFSDAEDDGETNNGAQDQHLVAYAESILEPMTVSYRRAMSLDGHDSENDRGST